MNGSRTNTLTIRTPEGIVFSLLLAGPITRCLAWMIDLMVVSTLMSVVNVAVVQLGWINPDWAKALTILSYFIVSTGYGMALEWYWRGQTLGKRMLRLRVMDEQGLRLQPSQIIVRNLLRFVDCLPGLYLVGGIACLVSRRAQRLGDFAANTIVIRTPKLADPDLDQLLAGKFNSFRQYPRLEARLRQAVTPPEASLTVQALLRRDELDPAARIELFSQLSALFRSHVEFPPEATDGLSDEQYVRNVVDIYFRERKTRTNTREMVTQS